MEISVNVDSNSDTLTSFHSYEYFVQNCNTENAAIDCEIINENNAYENLNPVNDGIFAISEDNIIEMKVDICGNPNNNDFQNDCRQISPTKLYTLNKEGNCDFQPSENDQESPELSVYPQNFDLNESYNNLENIAIDEQSNTSNINTDKDLFYVNKDDFEILNINYTTKEDIDSANSSRETKFIIPDTIPVLANSFLTMENSSNATDNCNAMTNNIICSVPDGSDPNHIFKLPNNELTFNGTLKHLQKLKPIVNTDTTFQSQFKDDFKDVFTSNANKESLVDDFSNKSNDYITSSPSADASNSKCNLTISSDSQYPSDYDIFLNVLSRTPSRFSNVEENQDVDSNTTFSHNEMTILKSKDITLDNTYNSGMCSPTLFSDNEDEVYNTYEDAKIEKEKSIEQFNEYDKKLVKKLEKSLQGVPPPPSITISQLTAADILQMYKTNLPKYDCIGSSLDPVLNSTPSIPVNCDGSADKTILNNSSNTLDKTVCKQSQKAANVSSTSALNTSEKLVNINGTQDLAINEKWPEIRSCRYYGIHYNCSNHSEDIDRLLCRYLLRYIGCETASSCLVVSSKKSPAKKSLRSNVGRSPGRRLSHLARRRISFCNADNVKQMFSAKRQILIDRTKYAGLFLGKGQTLRKSPRKKTPKKVTPLKRTPKSKTPKKKAPNSSQKKKTTRRLFTNEPSVSKSQPTKETSKRALFLSPENVQSKPLEEVPPCASTSKVIKSKRALFNTPQKETDASKDTSNYDSESTKNDGNNRKRFRLDDSISEMDYGPRVKLHRSLSFGGDKIESTAQELSTTIIKHASEQILNKNDVLSDLHKKKLLWAVAEALRCHSIGVKHDKFRLHMSSLARLTRKISQLPHHARTLRTPGNSTSETLRRIARQHAFSVIRGKSIDEIFIEEQTKHSNPQPRKLVGYVPLNSHESNKQSHSNFVLNKNSENSYDNDKNSKNLTSNDLKTVLQDKTINLNLKTNDFSNKLLVSEQKKSLLFKDNSKLHTCRQMSFDMNNFKR